MTGSRADRAGTVVAFPCLRAALAVAGVVLIAAGPLAARQPGPPIRLVPTMPGADQPPPEPPLPDPARREAGAPKPLPLLPPPRDPSRTDPVVPPPPPVRAETLAAPDPDGDGVLDSQSGGLGIGLWRGLPRGELLRLLGRVPVATPSPAARDLLRRLLLSAAAGPQPALDEPPPARRFGALKVAALAAMGEPEAALRLAAVLPDALKDEATARAVIDALLLQGPLDCPRALSIGGGFDGPYWAHLAVFCRARAGDRDGALVALGARRALGGGDGAGDGEAGFARLAEAMIGGPPPPPRLITDPTPLDLAMLRALNRPVPPGSVPPGSGLANDPARLAAVARNGSTDPLTRVTAAETAALHQILDARDLAAAYLAAPSGGDEAYRLRDVAARERGARVRGLVQQGFAGAMDGRRRLALAALALDLLDPPMWAGPVGATVAAMLDTVTVNAQAAPLAAGAARLYVAQAQPDNARRWLALAAAGGRGEGARLWPLAALSGLAPPETGLAAWLDGALRDPAAKGPVAGMLALLQAVGVAVPEDAWLAAADGNTAGGPGPAADPALWERLKRAATEGRTGETVLVSLLLMGNVGPAGTPPVVMARIVSSLRAVGLDDAARALARETAVAMPGIG